MWKPNRVRSKRYTMHGPSSSVMIWSEPRRLMYAANFAAQIPAVILPLVENDERSSIDSATMRRLLSAADAFHDSCT